MTYPDGLDFQRTNATLNDDGTVIPAANNYQKNPPALSKTQLKI